MFTAEGRYSWHVPNRNVVERPGRPGRDQTHWLWVQGYGGLAHLRTWSKLTVWRTSSGKVWLWLYPVSTAELRGRVTVGGRTHKDAHSSRAGHRTAHQSGFLPEDEPQLSRNSDTKDIPAYIWEWDLTPSSSAAQSYQLVYIFILFLYLLIWNLDIKKNVSILILYQIWHSTPEWLHCLPLMLDLGSLVFWVELVINTAACIFSGRF